MSNNNQNPKPPQWDSSSIGKDWQHRFFYLLIKLTGRRGAYAFLRFVVLWYLLFNSAIRKKCKPYITKRFPNANPLKVWLHSYHWVCSFGQCLIDRASFGILGPASLKLSVRGGDDLIKLAAADKPLIVLSAHAGCWQVAFSALAFLDKPVHLLMKQNEADIDKHYFEHTHQGKRPFEVIDPIGYLGGTVQMSAVLQQKEMVGIMGDRIFGNQVNAVPVDFLGGKVHLPIAAFRLAAAQNCPIAVILTHKASYREYVVELAGVIEINEPLGRNLEKCKPHAQKFANILEAFAQNHPYDLYNFYDLWQSPK